jgi:hypothetical protein
MMKMPGAAGRPAVGAGTSHPDGLPATKRLIEHGIGIIDVTSHCLYSVPRTWKLDQRPGRNAIARAPDGMATAEQDWFPSSSSWTAFTARLRQVLAPTLIHDDRAQRFWCEYAAGWVGIHHYVAVPAPGGSCATQIDINAGADDLLRQTVRLIVDSVGAVE